MPTELRPSVGRNLMALVRKDLIRPATSAGARDDGFRFRHALIRDAAYEGLPKEVRAELHECFAGEVEAYFGDYGVELEEIIGYHLEQAVRCRVELGRLDSATDELSLSAGTRLTAAGRRAFSRGDVPAAWKLLERAVISSMRTRRRAPRFSSISARSRGSRATRSGPTQFWSRRRRSPGTRRRTAPDAAEVSVRPSPLPRPRDRAAASVRGR